MRGAPRIPIRRWIHCGHVVLLATALGVCNGCIPLADLDNKKCPCREDWFCCEVIDTCVLSEENCTTPNPIGYVHQTDTGTDTDTDTATDGEDTDSDTSVDTAHSISL